MPVRNRIDLLISADNRATNEIKKFERQTKKSSDNINRSFTDMAVKAAAIGFAIREIGKFASVFVESASKVEQLRTRLTVLTGTVQKGNELFEDMANLASRVPFTYDEIMESAVNLRAVVKEGNEEVTRLMPIILDLAATTGLGIQETTSQMIRMYSAGAGAADLFRERGVLAMLGFQAGVSVSAEETMDRVIAAWEDGESRFRGATDQLAGTWQGRVSMMQDAWFNFTSTIGEGITDPEGTASHFLEGMTNMLSFVTEELRSRSSNNKELEEAGIGFWDSFLAPTEKLLLGTSRVTTKLKNQVITDSMDLGRIVVTQSEIEAEELVEIERQKVSFIETLHNNLTNKIIAFREKNFKDAEKKAKAESKLQQDILNAQISNFEKLLLKQAEDNKAAAIAYKGIQVGRAIINTSEAVTAALPNLALAALVAAIGAAEIATIMSVGFNKGTDSVPSMLTPGEMVVPRDFAQSIREGRLTLGGPGGGGGGDINIFIQGGIRSDGLSVEDMAERLGFEFERQIRVARG